MKKMPFDIEEYIQRVRSFHSYEAPGVIIGGFMVHKAREQMPEGTLFNALCETAKCLPDAVQLLTPCTTGNGRLRIIESGRFALSLYDKHSGNGFRVFIDPGKLKDWPEINAWFFKLKPKKEQNEALLLDQIKEAGGTLCGTFPVQVDPQLLQKKKAGNRTICPSCGESYPALDGTLCRACQGESPYIL